MALNTRRLDRSKQSSNVNTSGASFFKFSEGKNLVRLFSWPHTVRKSDFTRGFYRKDDGIKVGDSFDELDREVYRHFTEGGIVNCVGEDCKYCEESDTLLDSKNKRDQRAGNDIRANRAFYINLLDVDEPEKQIQIGSIPQSVYGKMLAYIQDPEFGEEILGKTGRDFIVERNSKLTPDKMYTVKLRDEKRCEKYEGELNPINLFDCKALDPGWSINEELNSVKEVEEEVRETNIKKSNENVDDKEKSENKSKSTPKDKDNDFEDEVDTNKTKNKKNTDDKPPWEKDEETSNDEDEFFEINDIVSFTDGDEGEIDGYVYEINDDMIAIQTGKTNADIFDVSIHEVTLVKKAKKVNKAKKSGRRRV